MIKFVFIILSTFSLAVNSELRTPCKNYAVQAGLNVADMLGQWNLLKYGAPKNKFHSMLNQSDPCIKVDFLDLFPQRNDTFGTYFHSPVIHDSPAIRSKAMFGIKIPDLEDPGRWILSHADYAGEMKIGTEFSIHVLHTDYKTALAMVCTYQELGGEWINTITIGMLSKEKTLDENVFVAYKYILSIYGISSQYLDFPQENCPNEYVILP